LATLLKTFPEVLYHSGLSQAEWRRFAVGSFRSNPQEIEDDVLKTFFLSYPKEKSHGLKSSDRAGNPTYPKKKKKRPGNIFLNTSSERRAV
jgi:hypothetical protein